MSKEVIQRMLAKGYTESDAKDIVSDVFDSIRECVEDQEEVAIRNLGSLKVIIKEKPPHLMKVGTFSKTFKVKFIQSRNLQKKYKIDNYGGDAIRQKVKNLLK